MKDHKGQEICTTDGRPGEEADRTILQDGMRAGQQKDYVVLCEAERAKGFVRPVRTSYRHVGRLICGAVVPHDDAELQQGMVAAICAGDLCHPEPCGTRRLQATDAMLKAIAAGAHHHGGCGGVTTMGQSLAETYARDPKFYGSTFCATCGAHFPVGEQGEFVWVPDGSRVGT